MKRRDFLIQTGVLGAGSSMSSLAFGNIPCPPTVLGGNSPTTSCSSAEADWQARMSGPGVVWGHDFRNEAEVDQFRWTGQHGNDPGDIGGRPNTIVWSPNGGISGGVLQCHHPVGKSSVGDWWRVFSPLDGASNGRGVDDPGANGTIPVRSWNSNNVSETGTWQHGWYGHSSYHNTGNFDGTTFFYQMRVKFDPNRLLYDLNGGKLCDFTRMNGSNTDQKIITTQRRPSFPGGTGNYFAMYRGGDTGIDNDDSSGSNQPGGEVNGPGSSCQYIGGSVQDCWGIASDGTFDTYLYEIGAGLNNQFDTVINVWAARQGQTSYTKIWAMNTMKSLYDGNNPFGRNAVIQTSYTNANLGNNPPVPVAFTNEYGQIIFSKEFIPCPQV